MRLGGWAARDGISALIWRDSTGLFPSVLQGSTRWWQVPESQKECSSDTGPAATGLGPPDSRTVSKCLSAVPASQAWCFAMTAWADHDSLWIAPGTWARSACCLCTRSPKMNFTHKLPLSAVFTWRLESRLVVARAAEMGYRVSFEGDENVLKLVLMVAQLCKYTKKIYWVACSWQVNFMVCELCSN